MYSYMCVVYCQLELEADIFFHLFSKHLLSINRLQKTKQDYSSA